ncbi:hypothetical protein Cassandra_0155 [Pseudomonas phage Cassandra]|nr:hypothetical protein Cassandra_0155 [Pseudomonas phage Cassandra]
MHFPTYTKLRTIPKHTFLLLRFPSRTGRKSSPPECHKIKSINN